MIGLLVRMWVAARRWLPARRFAPDSRAEGSGFSHDPDLELVKTGAHYRGPVIAWTKQLGTSPTDPLEAHIDAVPRNQ
jgi:hypothetical protein